MGKKLVLIALMLAIGLHYAYAQDNEHVTNIRAVQKDKIVNIKYDLSVNSLVKMLISLDDGKNYTDTMTVSGNVNRVIPPGKNRSITWKAFQDLGYGDYPEIRFKFITEEKPIEDNNSKSRRNSKSKNASRQTYSTYDKKSRLKTFATLNAGYTNTCIPSVGFNVGQYNKYGWYVTLMTGLDFDYVGYDVVDNSKINGYVGNILPFYNPESRITAVSGIVGGIARLNDFVYVKAGLGYGFRSVAWQLWEGTYVTNDGYSAHGVDINVGLLLDINRFIITIDGVTTNFKVFEARLGLGFRFTKDRN